MASVPEHYESHLAPIYVWMAGGVDAAITRGQAEVDSICPQPCGGLVAADLGAGFGMHAIPLANIGYSVLAIDSSGKLLDTLDSLIGNRPIKTVRDDLLSFKQHLDRKAALIVCLGDTLTHLQDRQSVQRLFDDVADSLADAGTFIITFRDYSSALTGIMRFIPVRSDADRILTCFLEYDEAAVTVHDILNEREGSEWQQRVSAYRKLRLSPEWVISALEARGFQVNREQGPAGMTRLIAKRIND
jgi:predicted RNA methylase